MRVLVTGAAGFIGRRLAALLAADGAALVLADRVAFDAGVPGAEHAVGDLVDAAFVDRLAAMGFDAVVHLAATLTVEAERDPGMAYAVTVEALRRSIAGARRTRPRVVFASSIAVFGGALPETVGDDLRPTPATTYGTYKAMAELLLADATRRGEVDGRSLRLPIVVTRPGHPSAAVSDRVAAIIREPLAGRDAAVPLAPATLLPLCSAGTAARALAALVWLPPDAPPPGRAFNLPALTVGVDALVAAVERRGGAGRLRHAPDPDLQRIVDGWPKRFVSDAADRLGLPRDADVDALIDDHLGPAREHADG